MPVPCSVSGSVHVGENAYLAGDIIRNQCTIGENAFVGLGCRCCERCCPGQTVVGNPAKPFIKKESVKNMQFIDLKAQYRALKDEN